MNKYNCSIGKAYSVKEKVSGLKFRAGMLNLINPILWLKDLSSLFNIRKIIIGGIIIGLIFGIGYWKGIKNKPVFVDFNRGKEIIIKLTDGDILHINKEGLISYRDKDGKILKKITVADIPGLKKKLSAFGFMLKPIAVVGIGGGVGGIEPEGGIGVSFLRWLRWRAETFITNRGIYLGASYKLDQIKLENSGIGIAIGKGFEGDNRALIYFRVEF